MQNSWAHHRFLGKMIDMVLRSIYHELIFCHRILFPTVRVSRYSHQRHDDVSAVKGLSPPVTYFGRPKVPSLSLDPPVPKSSTPTVQGAHIVHSASRRHRRARSCHRRLTSGPAARATAVPGGCGLHACQGRPRGLQSWRLSVCGCRACGGAASELFKRS